MNSKFDITKKLDNIFRAWELPVEHTHDIMHALHEAFMYGVNAGVNNTDLVDDANEFVATLNKIDMTSDKVFEQLLKEASR